MTQNIKVFNLASLEIAGMFGKYRQWNEDASTDSSGSCCITFEASCREDFHVGISTECKYQGTMYEIVGGAHGNTEAILRRKPQDPVPMASAFCGRICSATDFKPYWILLKDGLLAFGIGKEVGHDILVKTKDPEPLQAKYVSFSSWRAPVQYRNISIQSGDGFPTIDEKSVEPLIFFNSIDGGEQALPEEILTEYRQACDKAAKRANRFGGPYVVPDIKKFLPTQEVRRMQRSGAVEPGFVTGFDLSSDAEKAKREARVHRFQTPSFGIEFNTETARAANEGLTEEQWQTHHIKMENRMKKFGISKPTTDVSPASDKVKGERCDVKEGAIPRQDAIHMYSLDENFQRVRTRDILAHFDGYGPSYVEWINDSSCTVVFQDPFTVTRAMTVLCSNLPESDDTQIESNDGDKDEYKRNVEVLRQARWLVGVPIKKAGMKETWRVLLRLATEDDFPTEKKQKTFPIHQSKGYKKRGRQPSRKRTHSFEREDIDESQRERINKSSKRIHINEDGSIMMKRNIQEESDHADNSPHRDNDDMNDL